VDGDGTSIASSRIECLTPEPGRIVSMHAGAFAWGDAPFLLASAMPIRNAPKRETA